MASDLTSDRSDARHVAVFKIAGALLLLAGMAVILGAFLWVMLGVMNTMSAASMITETSTTDPIESVEIPGARGGQFTVTLNGEFDPAGQASLYIIGPDGDIYAERTIVERAEKVTVPEESALFGSPESGEYDVVVADSDTTYGTTTVTVQQYTFYSRISSVNPWHVAGAILLSLLTVAGGTALSNRRGENGGR